MAIHPNIPGIEVTVEVDGRALVEYDHTDEQIQGGDPVVQLRLANCTITKYIECVTDRHFRIKVVMGAEYKWDCPTVVFEVWIDGVWATGIFFLRTSYENISSARVIEGVIFGNPGSHGVLRKFKFAEIRTSSDSADPAMIQEEKLRMSKVGEVIIKAYRRGNSEIIEDGQLPRSLGEYDNPVNEKALKGEAKSHGVTLGDSERKKPPRSIKFKKLDRDDYRIARFKFNYRSNKALKQLQIIERTPEPQDLNLPDDLTADERREVKEFTRKMKMKRGIDPQVKLEGTQSAHVVGTSKRLRTTGPEIIDLTED